VTVGQCASNGTLIIEDDGTLIPDD
jgi:hypothetical protein